MGKPGAEKMVQGFPHKETCCVPHRSPYLLCSATNQRCADIHRPAAYVPFRHKHYEGICRHPEPHQDKGGEENAAVQDASAGGVISETTPEKKHIKL